MSNLLPRISTTTSSVFEFGYKVTAGQLKAWALTLPDTAEVTVTKYDGASGEPAETTFKATYPTEVPK